MFVSDIGGIYIRKRAMSWSKLVDSATHTGHSLPARVPEYALRTAKPLAPSRAKD